jgi:predicted signal transduction protein with EAL and GGDEF domain
METKQGLASWFQASTFGLSRRLTLLLSGLIVLFVAAVVAINLHTHRAQLFDRLEDSAGHLVALAQEVSVPHILDNDPAALELFYDEVGNQSDVEQVFLVGPHRWLLASGGNVDQEFLSFVADPLIERVLATGERHQVYDSHILSIAAPVFVGTRLIGVLRLDYCQKELLAKMQTVLVSNLFAGFIFLLAGLIFSRWAAARLSSPLMQLKDAARKAADGNLDTELKLQTNDEFSQVGEAFNTMMANMRTSMHEIHRVAYEDKLTGVPNRSWLNNQLEHLVLRHTKSETGFAVMFLDLDKFKAVNDTHGHHVGDLLLRAFSRRVARCMREERLKVRGVATDDRLPDMGAGEGVLARLGGDEFLLIVPTAKAEDLAERLVWAMSKPFKLEGCLLNNSTSIGIALYPRHATSREHLLKCADVAMYQAKRGGRKTYRYYDHSSHARMMERSSLERDLERAIADDDFHMVLQPQFEVSTGKVVGAEALIRWDHPTRGLVAPNIFIPVAASIGMLPQIGTLMLAKAIKVAADINAAREDRLTIAVNMTIEDLNEDGFADTVKHLLDLHGADPETLEIEITESTAMEESAIVERQVAELRAVGVRFAIDDFGMGYSNLGRLKALAFETLKIDRSLITGVGEDPASESLVHTILDMAKAIDAHVVAEGIEIAEQLNFLRDSGCAYYQGYYGSKPMIADQFADWVAAHERGLADPRDQDNQPGLKQAS